MSSAGGAPIDFVARMVGDAETASKLQSLGGAFGNFGKQADGAAGSMNKAETATKSIGSALKESTLSFSTAATTITNLAFQYDDLEKAELRIARAEKEVTSSQATLLSSQQALQSLTDKGITSGNQYEAAQLRLKSAQDNVAIATQNLDQVQGDLQESQLRFAMSVIPTVLSSVNAVQQGLKAFQGTSILATFSTRTLGASALTLAPALGGTGAAALGATGGLHAMAGGVRGVLMALGPIGLAIAGVSAVAMIFATNTFGIRDAMNAAGKAIGDAVPILRPLLDGLSSLANAIFPDATQQASELEKQLEVASVATGEFTNVTVEAGAAVTATGRQIKTYTDHLEDVKGSTEDTVRENMWFIQSVDAELASLVRTGEEINLVAGLLREQEAATQRTTQEMFSLVGTTNDARTALNLFQTEGIEGVTRAFNELQEATKEAGDEIDNVKKKAGGDIVERAISAGLIPRGAKITNRDGNSFTATYAKGGIINEPTFMVGLNTGRLGIMAEAGPEAIVPLSGGGMVATAPPSGRSGSSKIVHVTQITLDKRVLAEAVHEFDNDQWA